MANLRVKVQRLIVIKKEIEYQKGKVSNYATTLIHMRYGFTLSASISPHSGAPRIPTQTHDQSPQNYTHNVREVTSGNNP